MQRLEIGQWCKELLQKLQNGFGSRLCCVGLQGSYRRGEATEKSDIDIVLVLDTLSANDLQAYRALLAQMPYHQKACGFVCGKQELLHWAPSDLIALYHDTQVLYGSLGFLLPLFSQKDAVLAVKLSAGNLYHACCHSLLFENAMQNLPALYKQAFFLIQTYQYAKTGMYFASKQALLPHCQGLLQQILQQTPTGEQPPGACGGQTLQQYQALLTLCAQLLEESSQMG